MKKPEQYVLMSLLTVSTLTLADSGMYPNVGMDLDAAFQFDYTSNDSGPDRVTTDGYLDINPVFHFRLNANSEIWLDTEFSPVNDPDPGEERWFGDIGMVVNDLNYYRYADNYWLRIGKFEVPFGRAWDVAPGLYTSDFTDDYDLDGMLGGNLAWRFYTGSMGVIEPIVNLYTADTTFLSRAYFQHDEELEKSDGGPANTEKLNSWSALVNWVAIPAIPFLETQAGYMFNHAGEGDETDESWKTVSLRYIYAVEPSTRLGPTLGGKYLDFVPFVEYATVSNEGGVRGEDAEYLTTSLTVDYGYWNFGLTRTDKHYSSTANPGPDDYLNELSVQYNFTNLWSLQFSLGNQRTDGVKADIAGLAISYSGAF